MGQIHDVVTENNLNFWIFLGKMFNEVQENFKYQIANNYGTVNFQGYRVGVLNLGVPAIKKRVLRQIMTNAKNRGQHIDFAIVYGFEYSSGNIWQVTMAEDHQNKVPKYNLPALARKLGNTNKGGGGTRFIGNFYYNGNIFNLFK